jgi:hypothetical protein
MISEIATKNMWRVSRVEVGCRGSEALRQRRGRISRQTSSHTGNMCHGQVSLINR